MEIMYCGNCVLLKLKIVVIGNYEEKIENQKLWKLENCELWKLWKLWNLGNMFNMKIGNCGKYGFGELELLKQKIVRLEIVEITN